MPVQGDTFDVYYFAMDWSAWGTAPVLGDQSNHTVTVWTDEGIEVNTGDGPWEVDSSNAPGLYRTHIDASFFRATRITVYVKSSTSKVYVRPVHVDLYDLPDVALGSSGALPTADGNNYVAGVQGTKNTLDDMTDITPAEVNAQVADVLTVDTVSQPGREAPAASQTIAKMIAFLYKAWRNLQTQSSSAYKLYNDDESTVDQKSTVSESGGTVTKDEVDSGP